VREAPTAEEEGAAVVEEEMSVDEARVVTAAVMCEHGLNRCMVLPGSGLYGRLARSGLPLPEAAFSPSSHLIACGPTASGGSLETPA